MKVRIYKSGGSTGRFISKLERFLPTAAKGVQVDEMKQIKEAIKYQLDDKNQSASSVILQLVRGGYDYGTAKSLVDAAEEDLEESYYAKKSKKDSMLDSDVIPNEDEIESYGSEEDDRKKRKELSRNMQDDIAQTAQDASDDDSDDDQEYNEMLNEGSPYDDDLDTAGFGMEVDDSKIQWPGMFNDMSSFKNGGAPNKKKFINSTVKKLMKAKAGMETDPTANGMPNPYGTIDDPTGVDLNPNKSIVSAIKGTAQNYMDEQAYKQQAEEMYNQQFMQPTAAQGGANDWSTNLHNYGEALDHMMPNNNTTGINTSFSGDQMAFGGTRRVKRANKAFFGSPTAFPGATTDYEFGPLGGLRKGKVEYDLSKISEAIKANPGLASMFMPKMAMGMPRGGGLWNKWTSNNVPQFNPFGNSSSSYSNYSSSSSSSSSPQSRLKWATQTINNAADPSKNDEAGKLKNNSDQTNKRQKYQDYIDWWGAEGIPEGKSRQAPISFEEFIVKDSDGMSEYDYWANKSVTGSTPVGSVSSENPANNKATVVVPGQKNIAPVKKVEKPKEADPTLSASNAKALNDANQDAKVTPEAKVPLAKSYVEDEDEDQGSDFGMWDYIKLGYKIMNPMSPWGFAEGGFVDFQRPELNRFVYGGDEYEYGGGTRKFNPGGENQVDPNYRDAGGRNYQEYIDWYGENPVGYDPKTKTITPNQSRQAPQTYAEWKAEQEADKKPAGTTTTNTQGNTGTTNYDQSYFQNMFKNDPKFKQGFEQFIQTQGYPTNSQRRSSNFSQGDGMGGPDPRGAMRWTNNQGSQLVGTGPANRGFGSGLLGAVGLNKDFKAYYSPQGQITREMLAQAMKNGAGKVTETKFKDRGNKWNPFDNKKVTEWTIDPATGQPTPAGGTGGNNAPGYNPTAAGPGYSGYNADSDGKGMPDYLQMPNPQDKTNNPNPTTTASNNTSMFPSNNAGPMNTGENTGIDQTPDDWNYNQPAMDYMRQSLSVGNNAASSQGAPQNNMSSQGALSGVDGTQSTTANIPNTGRNEDIPKGMFFQTRGEGDYQAGVDRKGRLVSRGTPPPVKPTAEQTEGANKFMNMFNGRASSQPATSQPTSPIPTFNQNSTGNYMDYRGSSQPAAAPTQPIAAPTQPVDLAPYNTSGPMNIMDEETGMAYGGYMRQGGYIPEYMAYGGYMPDYGYGGYYPYGGSTVVGPNQEFSGTQQNNIAEDKDGNNIPDYLELGKDPAMGADAAAGPTKYRLEEENAWSWDPKKLGRNMDMGLRIGTGIDKKIEFAKNREQENSEFMYAQDVDRQLLSKGLGDPNEGVWKQNIGFESGRTYASKYGGAKFANGSSTYAKGKVYSLTMDEINEIKSRGGSVKFIK